MKRLMLDPEAFGLSSVMERFTRVIVKDCFKDDEIIYFIVAPGQLGKAIGKGGANIKRVQQELGKRIKVIEYNDNVITFVKNVIYPLAVEEISEQEGAIVIKDKNKKTKSMLIGRNGKKLMIINRAVQRFFNKEVKVVN